MGSEPARDWDNAGDPTKNPPVTLPQRKESGQADEKADTAFVEHTVASDDANQNLTYDEDEMEPELHFRTWIAIAAMFSLNLVQVFALLGPPAVLSFIGESLDNTQAQNWVPNSLSLVQAALGPVISSASDIFQARKTFLVASSLISLVGSVVAATSHDIYRLIAAQTLIGVGFASVPLAYAVPSEILPRRWRPLAQGMVNIAASTASITSPLIISALIRADKVNGWRKFWWIETGLWGATAIGLTIGYRPPKRHIRLDHLTFWQKIGQLDLIGFFLLTAGLSLLLTGLGLGGGLYSWTNVRVLITLVLGIVFLICFGLYEWKGTKTGILHHKLFRGGKNAGRTFYICVALIFVEGICLFAYVVFYPVMSQSLFTSDVFKVAVRSQPYWVAGFVSTLGWGFIATKFRTIREPLFAGFALLTVAMIGWATIEPGEGVKQMVFAAIAGTGFGAAIILIITGVQLSTPHALIATATAVTTSSRAVAASTFTAIYGAVLSSKLATNIPSHIAKAVLPAGLPSSSLPAFIQNLSAGNTAALSHVPGATPAIIQLGVAALKQAFAESIRIIYIIAAAFGALACVLCWFLGDMKKVMNYHVDAPVENLRAKVHGQEGTAAA